MAKDPAFLFYPGDYLRDTQTLSANSQVAYDRIMCEHMRNICISHKQLKFFTKRLSPDEIEELMFVLTEINQGYQIEWIAESIIKRKAYSDSRRKNREGKSNKDLNNISKTYDKHMENENEIENINKEVFNFKNSLINLGIEKQIVSDWLKVRSKKKASNTETAFNKIKNEIDKCNLSANDCIKKAVEKSWQGFESEWLKTNNNGHTQSIQESNRQPQNAAERGNFVTDWDEAERLYKAETNNS